MWKRTHLKSIRDGGARHHQSRCANPDGQRPVGAIDQGKFDVSPRQSAQRQLLERMQEGVVQRIIQVGGQYRGPASLQGGLRGYIPTGYDWIRGIVERTRLSEDDRAKAMNLLQNWVNYHGLVGLPFDSDEEVAARLETRVRQPDRLMLGEADLSFADAYTTKHPDQASGIQATTYESATELRSLYRGTYAKHRGAVEDAGAQVLDRVNATNLHGDGRLAPSYRDIHFNFPHTGRRDGSTPQVVHGFFQSASRKQYPKDRIHMAIVRQGERKQSGHYKGIYRLAQASTDAGYKLVRKRRFNDKRYPGYVHRQTKADKKAGTADQAREYTFEKMSAEERRMRERGALRERLKARRELKGYNSEEVMTDSEDSTDESSEASPEEHEQARYNKRGWGGGPDSDDSPDGMMA